MSLRFVVTMAATLAMAAVTSLRSTNAADWMLPPAAGFAPQVTGLAPQPVADAPAMRVAAADNAPPGAVSAPDSFFGDSFLGQWFDRVDQARASQPQWAAPLMTTPALLVQQFRYDFWDQHVGNGAQVLNFGAVKGLELIPTTNEIFVTVPSYQQRDNVKPASGFTD